MDHYLDEAALDAAMDALAAAYPENCTLFDLPYETYEKRKVRCLRLGSKEPSGGGPGAAKLGVFYTGSTHAREWGGADILVYLASDLLKAWKAQKGLNYSVAGKGPGVTYTAAYLEEIRKTVDLFLVPCVNPDGRAYSMTKVPLWRKNRNPASSGGLPNRVGVDINRNYDFLWNEAHFSPEVSGAFGMGSDDPGDDTFRGEAPNSEPETKNVVWVFDQYPHIKRYIDVHSYTGDVLYSWGDAPNQSSDPQQNFLNPAYDGKRGVDDLSLYGEYIGSDEEEDAIFLAKVLTDAVGKVTGETYETTQAFYLAPGSPGGASGKTYPTGGTADDYATSRSKTVPGAGGTLGFTIEFHRYSGSDFDYAFHPPFPKMADIIAEVDAALIAFCLSKGRIRVPKPSQLPEIVAEILFGVTSDGGGLVIINGKPVPVPPWNPLIAELSRALEVYMKAEALPAKHATGAKRAALGAMKEALDAAAKRER